MQGLSHFVLFYAVATVLVDLQGLTKRLHAVEYVHVIEGVNLAPS